LVEKYLQRAGYRVAIAQDGLSALRMIRMLSPALVVLDLMLPELDGQSVARAAREEHDVSIIMLTALGSTTQRVAGLEAGADDYLAKPFAPSELVARVRSVLRRTRTSSTSPIRYGDIMIDAVVRSDEGQGIQDRSIDVYVRRLRSKLGDDARTHSHVVTVRGIGYRLAEA